jgi:four helix bundle protein
MAPGGSHGAFLSGIVGVAKSESFAVRIYRETEPFPRSETYGLTSQMRRAAVSVASNIAEGQGRLTKGEFQQFLGHSRGSLLELSTQLAIASDLGLLDHQTYLALEHEAYQVLGLINRLLEFLRTPKIVETLKLSKP